MEDKYFKINLHEEYNEKRRDELFAFVKTLNFYDKKNLLNILLDESVEIYVGNIGNHQISVKPSWVYDNGLMLDIWTKEAERTDGNLEKDPYIKRVLDAYYERRKSKEKEERAKKRKSKQAA